MEQEISIRTFQIQPMKGGTGLGGLLHQTYDLQLLAATCLLDFDMSHNLYAYVYNEINEESYIQEMNKNVD